MPPKTNTHNNPPQSTPPNLTQSNMLNTEEIVHLSELFDQHRADLVCPNCCNTGNFRSHGSTKTEPTQPMFRCVSCGKCYIGRTMSVIINNSLKQSIDTSDDNMDSTFPIEDCHSQPTIENLLSAIHKLSLELSQARAEINNLRSETAFLKEKLLTNIPELSSNPTIFSNSDFPVLGTDNSIHAPKSKSPSPWHEPTQVQQLRASMLNPKQIERNVKRKAAAARFFQPPSPTQGFKYVYLSTKARLPVGKLRNLFRKLEINNHRILDIHYPDRNVVALLIHNDYENDLREQLSKFKITIKDDFDPLYPCHLRDPQLTNLSPDDKESHAFKLHCQRMERALLFIREPVKFAVARHFLEQGWITQEFNDEQFPNRAPPTQTTIDHVFQTEDTEMHIDNDLLSAGSHSSNFL